MFSKKLVVILLSLGVLVIVVLLGIGYKVSSKVAGELQTKINQAIKDINEKKDTQIAIKTDPFVCSGMMSYKCVSKNLEIFKKQDNQELVGFKDVTISMSDISTDKLKISLKASDISLDSVKKQLQIESDTDIGRVYDAMKPRSFECDQKVKMLDKKTGEIQTQTECKVNSKVLVYKYNNIQRTKSNDFIDKTIFQSMAEYFSSFGLGGDYKPNEDFEFAVDNIAFELSSQHLKEFLYPIVKASYDKQKLDAPFDDNIYSSSIENLRNLVGIGLGVMGVLGSPYQDALLEFVDGVKQMATDEALGVKISLLPKQEKASYFKIPLDTSLNIDRQGVQQKILAKMYNNYDLKTTIIPNATK